MISFKRQRRDDVHGLARVVPFAVSRRAFDKGSWYATPGFWDAFGRQSMSLPSAITGPPDPHLAIHPVGRPETSAEP